MLIKQGVVIVLVSVVLFPSWAFLSYTYIPITAQTCVASKAGVFIDAALPVTAADFKCPQLATSLYFKVNFAVYAITLMTVCGWAMLIWFLPTGMWAYAFDYIGMWIHRPKPMSPEQFTKAKTDLAQTIEILLKKGRELVEVK